MKKTVRLTERDLTRIVKRIINENEYDGASFGHDTQEQEDAADEIMQKMGPIIQGFDEVYKILYKSEIMSYSEAKRLKKSFDDIHQKIMYTIMKYEESTEPVTDLSADWDRSQQNDIYNSNRDFINNR